MKNAALDPFLWRDIAFRLKNANINGGLIENLTKKFTQVSSLDLSYCDEIGESAVRAISQNCDPKHFKELNLNGCRKINDQALKYLVSKFLSASQKNSFKSAQKEFSESQDTEILNSIKSVDVVEETKIWKKKNISPEEQNNQEDNSQFNNGFEYENMGYDLFDHKYLSGGARALIKITLSECKLITDKGVKRIGKLKNLKFLSLSGCHYVTDKGACHVLNKCKNLEVIDLSGTKITTKTIDHIYSDCPNLKKLSARGCGINGVDLKVLNNREIDIEYGDSLCRFYIFSEKENDIPNISKNFFETRSDLSIHRLKLFVKERLRANKHDYSDEIEIVYQQRVLEDQITIQNIYQINKLPNKDEIIMAYRKKKLKKSWNPCPPPSWTDKHEAHECMNPECGQSFGKTAAKVNCYCCGKIFCSGCSRQKLSLKRLGYDDPMTVCILCWLASKERYSHQLN